MAGLSTLQSGPKGFKRDQNGQPHFFYHLRPFWAHLDSFGPFQTKVDVLLLTTSATVSLNLVKKNETSEGIFRDPTKYWTTKKICKIGPLGPKEKIDFLSFFLMRKRLYRGQKWFLRPYFPLIWGMFLLRSGLRFSFRALEVPEPRVRKMSFSLTKMTFSSLSVWALPVPQTKI